MSILSINVLMSMSELRSVMEQNGISVISSPMQLLDRQNVNIGTNVHIGNCCRLQNNVSVYEG